ncbi:MAG: iron-sulfur cluster assembly accessory protein [Cyanobacteria bacterium P01_G01_bin.38]
MLQLTPAAVREIARLQSKQPTPIYCRLGVRPGICADWTFELTFDPQQATSDRLFEFDQVQLVVADTALKYVSDVQIDYSEDLMGGAFRFAHPRAIATCQCGLAFTLSPLSPEHTTTAPINTAPIN